MIDVALEYHDMGLSIIPMRQDTKSPHLMSWKEYQSKVPTRDQIKKWWTTWPDAMIGLVTGNLNGICLVDADSVEAGKWLKSISPEIGDPHAKTPRPGWHWYFKTKENIRCLDGQLHKNIDIKGEGGLAIIPPSNRNGKSYQFIKDDFDFRNLPEIPSSLLLVINDNTLYCNDYAKNSRQHTCNNNVTNVTFDMGGRDNALFHLANHLVKGGMPHQNIRKYLHFYAQNCTPPFSEKETELKIKSALDRKNNQEKSFYEEVKDWICNTDVTIKLQDGYNALHCVTREDKAKLRVYFKRLTEEKVIMKTGTGQYRLRKDNIEWLDIDGADTTPFPIKWPLGVEKLVKIPKGGLVLVAGQQGAGKTAYLLNLAKMNMNRGKDVIFLSTETKAQGLKIRLEAFGEDGISISELTKGIKFAFLEGDVIEAIENYSFEDSILILDYLEVDDNFWLVGKKLTEIFKKMKGGVPIVGLQMHQDRLLGGRFGFQKPEMVLTIKKDKETRYSSMTIEKARWWADPSDNPEYKSCVFSLRSGCIMRQLDEWEVKKSGK